MSTITSSLRDGRAPGMPWIIGGLLVVLLWAVVTPNLLRSRMAADESARFAHRHTLEWHNPYDASLVKARPVPSMQVSESDKILPATSAVGTDAMAGRKIIRTSSMEMVVQHTAQISDEITALAERLGGYLVTADSGGLNATNGSLTIRVPAARFEQARTEIRKLGLRVESEQIEAQDVTRQYVDQDASIRNLRAEEAQYLAIMKQANTVKDMLAVSEQLSSVRGQVEQQQAEFNALSRQIETVAIAVSLHTESEAQAFWPNWRPSYQLKVALRDGVESLGMYATAMTTIVFYLPAIVLWVATILGTIAIGTKAVRGVGRRWFVWKTISPAEAK